jgi:N-hydroxyarylamine O-acetyltransferase
MFSVPFENLDIHLGRRITLDETAFYDKVVLRKRGGFCYELNGLFACLLRSLGFRVTMHSARVYGMGRPGPDFDHMVLLVSLQRQWLVDVGFGDSFLEPLLLDESGMYMQSGTIYRIRPSEQAWLLLEQKAGKEPEIIYDFSLRSRELAEFSEMCLWQQTSPDSHFTQKRVCSLATRTGRVTLSDMNLIVTEKGVRREQQISGEEEYRQCLTRYFDVDLA